MSQMDTRNPQIGLDFHLRTALFSGRLPTPLGPVSHLFRFVPCFHECSDLRAPSWCDTLHRAFSYVLWRLSHGFWCRPTCRWLFPRKRHVRMHPFGAYCRGDPRCPEWDQRHLPDGLRRWRRDTVPGEPRGPVFALFSVGDDLLTWVW